MLPETYRKMPYLCTDCYELFIHIPDTDGGDSLQENDTAYSSFQNPLFTNEVGKKGRAPLFFIKGGIAPPLFLFVYS